MSFRPRVLHDAAVRHTDPQAVVEAFLGALAAGDVDTANELLDEHVTYVNVGFPAVRGRRRTIGFIRPLARPGVSLEVYLHAIAANGSTVLTERTDVLSVGPCRLQFWVTGRFDVQDGRITLWRDSFDYLDMARALVRGLLGVVIPPLRPAAPGSADVAPGRH
ncbi:MAG: limonene,2-epoxide hydrolase [Pseudonocardiales bacterium]|nr:limonene,2-epoxide hydrolase [Pseudonocardiales bacterium]